MIALKVFIKILPYLWPFIREMILGKKSFLVAIIDNKKKVFFITLVLISFGLNFLTVPRLLTMSVQYVTLDKRYKELEAQYHNVSSSAKHPNIQGSELQVVVKKETQTIPIAVSENKPIRLKKHPKASTRNYNQDQVTAQFEKIRQREEQDIHKSLTD